MYAGGGEAADQTVRLMLAGCETAVRLGGSGLKNVLAISLALVRNNKQISGKVNLGKMLRETRDLRLFPMTGEQYREFAKLAKPQKLLYSVIRDKDSGKMEVVLPVTELERANLIFEKMLYNLPEQKSVAQQEQSEPEQAEQQQGQPEPPEQTAPPEPQEQQEQQEQLGKQSEKSEQLEMPLPPERQEEDSKKEYRLASDLNAIKPSSSIWKESESITPMMFEKQISSEYPTMSERISVEKRLKAFQSQIEAANVLEPTRTKVKNREQAR